MTVIGWPKQATTDPYAYVPSPERCWEIAVEGGLRLNEQAKVNALMYAAVQAEADWRFIGERENWLHIRRLMDHRVRGDEFGVLIAAVAEGFGPKIRTVAERLVNLS